MTVRIENINDLELYLNKIIREQVKDEVSEQFHALLKNAFYLGAAMQRDGFVKVEV